MIGFLKRLISKPCQRSCSWEEHSRSEWGTTSAVTGQKRVLRTVIVLRCATCGELKSHVVRP